MDMKILLVSDSHGDYSSLDRLYKMYPEMDLYLHAGDSEQDEFSIKPFISVSLLGQQRASHQASQASSHYAHTLHPSSSALNKARASWLSILRRSPTVTIISPLRISASLRGHTL